LWGEEANKKLFNCTLQSKKCYSKITHTHTKAVSINLWIFIFVEFPKIDFCIPFLFTKNLFEAQQQQQQQHQNKKNDTSIIN